MLKPGETAPSFTLKSSSGQSLSLADFVGRKNVVLYFYPRDGSVGCTRQASAFKVYYQAFESLDAIVLGVSSDSIESHEKFSREQNLPFQLLSDQDGSIMRAYGVKPTLKLLGGRCTFVIDKNGIIRHVYSSQTHPARHAFEALQALKSIAE